ncbi:hypothetical protein ACLOJK_013872 [Asimina triloba]
MGGDFESERRWKRAAYAYAYAARILLLLLYRDTDTATRKPRMRRRVMEMDGYDLATGDGEECEGDLQGAVESPWILKLLVSTRSLVLRSIVSDGRFPW